LYVQRAYNIADLGWDCHQSYKIEFLQQREEYFGFPRGFSTTVISSSNRQTPNPAAIATQKQRQSCLHPQHQERLYLSSPSYCGLEGPFSSFASASKGQEASIHAFKKGLSLIHKSLCILGVSLFQLSISILFSPFPPHGETSLYSVQFEPRQKPMQQNLS
jgi:hypothetical protein